MFGEGFASWLQKHSNIRLPCSWAAGTHRLLICQGLLGGQLFPSVPCFLVGPSGQVTRVPLLDLEDRKQLVDITQRTVKELIGVLIRTGVGDVCLLGGTFRTRVSPYALGEIQDTASLSYRGQ